MKRVENINITVKEGVKMSFKEFEKIHGKHFKVFKEKDREPKMKAKYIELFPESQEAKSELKKEDKKQDEKEEPNNEPKNSSNQNKPDKS